MRIWSVHPKYLDAKGLVALWRETLLAKRVLQNKTNGYRHHPQLTRFKNTEHPIDAINYYLTVVYDEASKRNYHFARNKIGRFAVAGKIQVTSGQLQHEFSHLLKKLQTRDPERYKILLEIDEPDPHPLFSKTDGPVENWGKSIGFKD